MKKLIILFLITIIFISCKKEILENNSLNEKQIGYSSMIANSGIPITCVEDLENDNSVDSVFDTTILGSHLIGHPYSISQMQLASQQILGTSRGVQVNARYYRFKPQDFEQLTILENSDFDIFDYPLDYEVVHEGDYYPDSTSNNPEEIPWFYAVVPTNITIPSGIPYELLEEIYIPVDYRVELQAFQNTGNTIDNSSVCGDAVGAKGDGGGGGNKLYPGDCWGDCDPTCPAYDPANCGGGSDGGGGGTNVDTHVPKGRITVTDDIINTDVGVRKGLVIARRFLKVDRTYTNNNGEFTFSKSFSNKVRLFLKLKNEDALVSGLRGTGLWNSLLAVRRKIGKFSGVLSNITHNIPDNNNLHSIGARMWASTTTHNNIQEYKFQRAAAENIGVCTERIKVLVTPVTGAGSTPMFHQRFTSNVPSAFIRYFISNTVALSLPGAAAVFASKIDMVIGYKRSNATMNSDDMSELCFHELTHAAYYSKVGTNTYGNFVQAEINEIISTLGNSDAPYGDANSGNAPFIALGESWAYHIGHYFTGQKYGFSSQNLFDQGQNYSNNFPVNGLNSHFNLLEDFSPRRETEDVFYWIPQGLFYDLFDDRDDETANFPNLPRVPVADLVSSYTNQQFFNALDNDINNLSAFRIRLLNENNQRDAVWVTTIFNFYGY